MSETPEGRTEEHEATAPKDFLVLLSEIDKGRAASELTAGMAELVEAVTAAGKKGRIALTVEVAPAKTEGAAHVDWSVKVTPPPRPKSPSLFFIDEDNSSLVRTHPRQHQLY